MNFNSQNFYFTFGSWEGFPFQNGYAIVQALNKVDAIATFRQHHPDVHENTVNCSFIYSEQEWLESENSYDTNCQFEILISHNLEIQQDNSKENCGKEDIRNKDEIEETER